jgi:hypothetical protein
LSSGPFQPFNPRALLVAENLCPRLLVLQRRYPQPRLRNADRQFRICASRWFAGWRNSLLIVRPETLLRWHRRGWRAYRPWRSNRRRRRRGRPPIPRELQALIRQLRIGSGVKDGRGVRALRRLLELKRIYPSAPFLAAVDQALEFSLFDLGRSRS